MIRTKAISAIAILTLVLTACGADAATITVEDAWARTSPSGVMMGAAYMNITSSVDVALVGASVDKSVAMMSQIHETTSATDGSMGMHEIESLPLVAGVNTELKPGGYHIMLMKLAKPLVTGESLTVTLTFASGSTQIVEVPILDQAP